ncbi:UNVERIFIED_CONTAM: hypothetical protein H355_000178 [Colinus virginianus]|nr:hypothetical protein H355_000178 [Colinus virginianus]
MTSFYLCPNTGIGLIFRKDTVILSFSAPSGEGPRSSDLKWEQNKECAVPTRRLRLCLSGNKLGDEGCSFLLENLSWISISKQLDLSHNFLSINGIYSLLRAVSACQKVVEVEVRYPPLLSIWILTERKESQAQARYGCGREESLYPTDDQWDDKENQIPTHSKKIRLTDCHFQASDLEKLCAVLKECGSISELELNNNQISLSSVFCLAQSLHTLENIETMNLRPRRTSRWRKSFLERPKHVTSGQRFSLRDCTVGPEDVTRLCQILTQCTQLTEIDLSGNALSDQSIERLLSFLPCLCQLTLLRLTDCAIGQGQMEELCRVLEQHGWLAELDLSRNQLGDEGLKFLLDHLHRVPVTCSLNLSHNRISQRGVLHLINAFTTSGSTTEVQVRYVSPH